MSEYNFKTGDKVVVLSIDSFNTSRAELGKVYTISILSKDPDEPIYHIEETEALFEYHEIILEHLYNTKLFQALIDGDETND